MKTGRSSERWNGAGRSGIRENSKGRVSPFRNSSEKKIRRNLPDYGIYTLSVSEKLRIAGEYILLNLAVSTLFYRSVIVFLLLLPGIVPYMRKRKNDLKKRREGQMRQEFLDGMQFTGTALQSGYAMENAFSEALTELRKIYDEDSFIVREFGYIAVQIRMNVPVEKLLLDLGYRSHIDDIRNFADVFLTARKTGGDMIAIVRTTIFDMRQKDDTRQEIETVLAGKKMEQNIMSVIPLAILVFVSITDPEFLTGMYHTPEGILIMTACLILYGIAWVWGRKIMDIT